MQSFKGDWDEVNKRGPKTPTGESSSMNSVYLGGALILVLALLAYYFQLF